MDRNRQACGRKCWEFVSLKNIPYFCRGGQPKAREGAVVSAMPEQKTVNSLFIYYLFISDCV